jgi:hypothetical protein
VNFIYKFAYPRIINDEVAYKTMVNCTNAVELKSIAEYMFAVRFKRKKEISKRNQRQE